MPANSLPPPPLLVLKSETEFGSSLARSMYHHTRAPNYVPTRFDIWQFIFCRLEQETSNAKPCHVACPTLGEVVVYVGGGGGRGEGGVGK